MTTQLQATSVSTSVEVNAPAEHAFRVFTEGIGSWWDPSHHILEASFKGVARALRDAVRIEGGGVPSTKGTL